MVRLKTCRPQAGQGHEGRAKRVRFAQHGEITTNRGSTTCGRMYPGWSKALSPSAQHTPTIAEGKLWIVNCLFFFRQASFVLGINIHALSTFKRLHMQTGQRRTCQWSKPVVHGTCLERSPGRGRWLSAFHQSSSTTRTEQVFRSSGMVLVSSRCGKSGIL